ncbi:hypothetical protein [Arsenicicoccus bolidensis]|uniref:hypothetical protein n=1 Tax=Arsenicicoccus bolidensis TaxID=229480 RepID=UPI000426B2CC|nr:hypothetical protein [Arsenicicoccus bolidensis]
MFRNKYKIEKKSRLELAQEDAAAKAHAFTSSAGDKAAQVKDSVMTAPKLAAGAVASGALAAADKVKDTVSHGSDVVEAKTSKADKGNGLIEDLMEALPGLLAAGTAAKAATSDKAQDAGKTALGLLATKKVADKAKDDSYPKTHLSKRQLKKELKARERKQGKLLVTLGLLATAAAVAAVVYKKTAPQDDPWATPLADPYTPASSTIGTSAGAATGYASTTTATTSDDAIVSDHEAGDPLSAVSTEPVILDAKDQEEFAATTPSDATAFDRTDDGAGQTMDHNAGTDKPRDNDVRRD